MDVLSLVISALGLAFSGWAIYKADSAKKAVVRALGDRNTQDDISKIRELILALHAAKDAVNPWVVGMPQEMRQGRNQVDDLGQLNRAVDVLRTRAPHGADEGVRRRITKSANLLDKQFKAIADGESNDDHWKTALSELQLIIPKLEQAEREMKDNQIKV